MRPAGRISSRSWKPTRACSLAASSSRLQKSVLFRSADAYIRELSEKPQRHSRGCGHPRSYFATFATAFSLVRLMFPVGRPVIEMARARAGGRSARFPIQTFAHRLNQLLRTVGLLKEYRRRAREESGSRQIRAVATGVDYF